MTLRDDDENNYFLELRVVAGSAALPFPERMSAAFFNFLYLREAAASRSGLYVYETSFPLTFLEPVPTMWAKFFRPVLTSFLSVILDTDLAFELAAAVAAFLKFC